jgi:hypothetical protein
LSTHGHAGIGELLSEGIRQGPRHIRCEIHLVQHVAIALEEPDGVAGQSEHLIAIGGLQNPPERLAVKAVGNHRELGDGALHSEYAEQPVCREHGQAVE